LLDVLGHPASGRPPAPTARMTPTVVFDSSKMIQQDNSTARVLSFDANDNPI